MENRQVFWIGLMISMLSLFEIPLSYAQEDKSENLLTRFTETFDGSLKNVTAVRLQEWDRFINITNTYFFNI